jgi:hypothetical protein
MQALNRLSTPPLHFALVILEMGVSKFDWVASTYDPPNVSLSVARIIVVSHQCPTLLSS